MTEQAYFQIPDDTWKKGLPNKERRGKLKKGQEGKKTTRREVDFNLLLDEEEKKEYLWEISSCYSDPTMMETRKDQSKENNC
eukprot:11247531-Ditylum_brightwellii.AAC.1